MSKSLICTIAVIFLWGLSTSLLYVNNLTLYQMTVSVDNVMNNSKAFHFGFNVSFNPTLPSLCMVTRIYQPQMFYFPILALGLYHTGLHNIRIYVINTDNQTNIQQLQQTIQFLNNLVVRKDFVTFLDLGEVPIRRDFGYGMTDRALMYLYEQFLRSPSICQYVTFTNADNFYSRNFAKKILPHMKNQKDIITWSLVSHHFKPRFREHGNPNKTSDHESFDDATEKCTPAILRGGCTDLGAVAYRLAFLQKHNLTFFRPNRLPALLDGHFVDDAIRLTKATILIKQTLYVHQ